MQKSIKVVTIKVVTIDGLKNVPKTLKKAVANQVVSVGLDAFSPDFKYYESVSIYSF